MASSAALLVPVLLVTAAAAVGWQSFAVDHQRVTSPYWLDRQVSSSRRPAADETDAPADREDDATVAGDAHSISAGVLRVQRSSSQTAENRDHDGYTVGPLTDYETSQDHLMKPLDPRELPPIGEHDSAPADDTATVNDAYARAVNLIDPRIIIISSNSSILQGTLTALAVTGKILLTALLLCLAVMVFFALGVVGNTSQVYNRYGHYDPYSPWGPYTANGAIDQPGFKGRVLDTDGGPLRAILGALEAALTGTTQRHPPEKCRHEKSQFRPAKASEWSPPRTKRSQPAAYDYLSNMENMDAPDHRHAVSWSVSRRPPSGDRTRHQLWAAPRQSSENGPVLSAVQSVVSVLVPVALVLPWVVILLFPGLLPAGDGSPVAPEDFPFDSDDDDNDRPYRRLLRRQQRRRRRRDLRS